MNGYETEASLWAILTILACLGPVLHYSIAITTINTINAINTTPLTSLLKCQELGGIQATLYCMKQVNSLNGTN